MAKQKFKPVVVVSREGMQGVVASYVSTKLELAGRQVAMEQEIVSIQKRHQPAMDELATSVAAMEAGLEMWASSHPEEFPGGRKSIELPVAVIGFRTNPPKVEKTTKANWGEVAKKLASLVTRKFRGADYVDFGEPTVDKDGLIRDRAELAAEDLAKAGIAIVQDETFFITVKSDVVEGVAKDAA